MMQRQKLREEHPELFDSAKNKKKGSARKLQTKLTPDELAEKKLFNRIESELKEIEKKRESEDLQNKASILTFNASGNKKHNSSSSPPKNKQSFQRGNIEEKKPNFDSSPRVWRPEDPQRLEIKLRSITPKRVAITGQVDPSKAVREKALLTSHNFEDLAGKRGPVKPPGKNPRPAGANESSSLNESPEGALRSPEKKRASRVITPINPELYQKLQKKDPLSTSSYKPFESRQLEELRPKPKINEKSKVINEKLNRGYFDNVHERLFYKGIETLNKRKELESIEFSRVHTFKPMTGKDTGKTPLRKEDIDKLVYSYRDKDTVLDRMRFVTNTFDKQDGKQLFSPRINRKPPVSHAYTLEEVEKWKRQSKDYLVKLRQIFDFLDRRHTGVIEGKTLDFENMHPTMQELLASITSAVMSYDAPLTFSLFFDLIEDHQLTENVVQIFDTINREPLVNPKPLKTKNFKFT